MDWTGVAVAVGFLVVLIISIVTLVQVGRTKTEVDELTHKAAAPIRAQQGQINALTRALQAQRAGGGDAMRATVSGSLPSRHVGNAGGVMGAPFHMATPSRTFGVPFPFDRPNGTTTPMKADSIWSGTFPPSDDPSYKGARGRQSAEPLGAAYALTGSRDLFNRAPDELDARDMDVARDAFPSPDAAAPKNGNEAIAAMYNFDNYRAAVDRLGGAGYLRPIYEQQGWSKLGTRNTYLWQQWIKGVRDAYPKDMSLEQVMDGLMAPVPEQFADYWYAAAEARDIPGVMRGDQGMGAEAAGALTEQLQREWSSGKEGGTKVSGAEVATLIQDALQTIPANNASAAIKAIGDIRSAYAQAARDSITLPELSGAQLQALANYASHDGPARSHAMALARDLSLPLPPASY